MATFTDDFNRSDSTDLGAGWVEVSGDWSIVSGQLSPGSGGGTVILRAAGAMDSSDHYAQATIAATTAASHGIWCRGNTGFSSGYLWRNDGSEWTLFSVVSSTFTNIGSYAAAAAPGDVAKVQAVGSTIKAFVNGVERVSVTDTAVATGTSVGFRSTSSSSIRFDDFTAADVTAGAALGTAAENDGAQALAGSKTAVLGTATAAEAAQPLAGAKTALLGTAAQAETAQPLTGATSRSLSTAASDETARPITGAKSAALGTATEADTARPMTGTGGTMPFPVGAETVTITGSFTIPAGGGGRSGRISFRPTAVLVDATHNTIYTGAGAATLSAGSFSIELLKNGTDDVLPAGWLWQVDEQPTSGERRIYYIDLSGITGPAVDLSDLSPVSAPDGTGQSLPPTGPAGGALTGSYPNPQLSVATIESFDPAGAAAAAQTAAAADATTKAAAAQAAAIAAAAISLATHEADTTAVHGIADTAALETATGAQAKVNTHAAASDPHGDRSWANGQFYPLTSGNALDGYINDLLTRTTAIEGGTAFLSGLNVNGLARIINNELRIESTGGTIRHRLNGAANTVGLYGATPVTQQTVTGSRADGTALGNLLAALASTGLIVNSTTTGQYGPQPSDQGLLAWTGDPNDAGHVTAQSSAGVAGRITLVRIAIREQITWSNIWLGLSGIDAGASLSNCYLGVYNSSGTLVGSTADISSSLMTGATAKALPLASPFVAPAGFYYIAMLLNGTWTTNSLTFKSTGAGVSVNANLAAPNLRFSNMLTGQTSLPSSLTLSSQSTSIINTGWASQWYAVS